MHNHGKKMIAPIIITIFFVIYYIIYFAILMKAFDGFLAMITGIIPLILIGVMIHVCIQRIHEIKGGEEDDLSQY